MYPDLKRRYGRSKYYSKGQVLRTIQECGFKEKYAIYGFAIFLEKSDFFQLTDDYTTQELNAARQEIADRFFNGYIDYTFKEIAENQFRNYPDGGVTGSGIGTSGGD